MRCKVSGMASYHLAIAQTAARQEENMTGPVVQKSTLRETGIHPEHGSLRA